MKGLYYTLNVFYVTFVPALAIMMQGGLGHDFVFANVSVGLSKYFQFFSVLYVIAMLLVLSFLVYQENNERVLLALLLSGPISGLFIAWATGGRPISAIYHMYLIEGGSLIAVLLFQTARHIQRIQKESGTFAPVVLGFFLLSFLGGFLRSINFDYLQNLYAHWLGYVGLCVALLVSFSSIFWTLDRIDDAHGRSRFGGKNSRTSSAYAFPEMEEKSYHAGTPLILLSAILGFLAFGFHEKLLEWEWLMQWLR